MIDEVRKRRATRTVSVGGVAIGGDHPIRVQSMITANLADAVGAAREVEALVRAGCELVRVTTPSRNDVQRLSAVRRELVGRGIRVPIVADVHFTPQVAFEALDVADKVRINPGNFADRKRLAKSHYSERDYELELERIAECFSPLVRRAKVLGRALRIGTNHGSLSDRVLNRFGDTPLGMVESALEYYDVCRSEQFPDVIFSMKSSNPKVMIAAYRLLVERLDLLENAGAPLHLGVTEAGRGIDGRVKSAVGIGTLIEEGLGDTIRVSLTEPSVNEIPVARLLARRSVATNVAPWRASVRLPTESKPPADEPTRSASPPLVELEVGPLNATSHERVGAIVDQLASATDLRCEGVVVDLLDEKDLGLLESFAARTRDAGGDMAFRVRADATLCGVILGADLEPVLRLADDAPRESIAKVLDGAGEDASRIEWSIEVGPANVAGNGALSVLLAESKARGHRDLLIGARGERFIAAHRWLRQQVESAGFEAKLTLRHPGTWSDPLAAVVHPAVELGALLCDGMGSRVSSSVGSQPLVDLDLLYRVLQASRARTIRPEYISCPSCGRTQFDLESVTQTIQNRTQHLKDIKIAIMGCIVNGPGEMADADFGYVGSGPGTVHLFVGRTRVESHVPEEEAPDRLEALIRRHDRWVERSDAGGGIASPSRHRDEPEGVPVNVGQALRT